jgi:trehalose 6-phosphate phosphatase
LPDLHRVALFLDVDGTLLEIKPDPRDVISHEALRHLLITLRDACDGALALVSGRSLSDLDRIFSPLKLCAAGLHGAELRLPTGGEWRLDGSIMDHARQPLAAYVFAHDGLMLEDKGASLAIHYRHRPELARDIVAFMSRFCPGDDVALQEGKYVVELKPALFDKGTAISAFMDQNPFKGRVPIFFGDDLTDEAGFAEVNGAGGISVRIGQEAQTKAQHRINTVEGLFTCLSNLAGARL